MNESLQNPIEFSKYVETEARKADTTYLDIIATFCDANDVEYEDITKYITANLKQKIRYESEQLRYYKKSGNSLF